MDLLTGFLYFAFDAAAILLLFATWQHTRISGFLVLAASYVLTILTRWLLPLLARLMETDAMGSLSLVYSASFLLIAAVGLYGLWDVYRQLRRRPAHASTAD